jgi:hypothetical protein
MYYHEMSIYEKLLTHGRPGRGGPGRDERSSRARGGGGGATLQHGNQIPDSMCPSVQILQGILIKFQFPSFRVSGAPPWVRRGTPKTRFHVSKCADSRILLCKFQIPSFRVSKAFLWVRARTMLSRFLEYSYIPGVQIPGYSSANSRFQDSECADSRILSANSRFRVSEFPRPPLGSGLEVHPNSRFRVIPTFPRSTPLRLGPRPRDPQIPDSEFPSFRGPLFGP